VKGISGKKWLEFRNEVKSTLMPSTIDSRFSAKHNA